MPRRYTTVMLALLWSACLAMCCAWAAPRLHEPYEPSNVSILEGQPNLFLKAPLTASPHWSDRVPEFAVDGDHSSAGQHWAAENIPVNMTLDLEEPARLNVIRLWTFWDNTRYYQYHIEVSADGDQWTKVVDQSANTLPSTSGGRTFFFDTVQARYVRVTFTHNSVSNVAGGHIVEIEGYALSAEQVEAMRARTVGWADCQGALQGSVGSTDVRYPRDECPRLSPADVLWSGTAWRGERASGQLLLWSREGASEVRLAAAPLRSEGGDEIPASRVSARFVRYVLGDGQLLGDVLDTAERLDLQPETVRPVWVSVDVPADAKAGRYSGTVSASARGGHSVKFDLTLEVLERVLPKPADWSFHLDLWQNPYAIARFHRVEPWSDQHLQIMEPHLRMLAQAGQKCVTTTILYQAWGTQTYDPYDSMVQWVKRADGSWAFDYTHFDKYVELAQRCGITDAINCYSMLPWTMRVRYLDETTGDYEFAGFHPGDETFAQVWEPFLDSFVAHLRERGWLERTHIAMDERPPELMTPALEFLRKVAPELKVALAGSNSPELKDKIDDWCVFISPPLSREIAAERIALGKPTTFYVCCGPLKPNTFTFSPPAESAWIGWYAAARGYSGFLRWAFDSWVENPLDDTSYVRWPAGDCFLTYPGARSSVRFERLREGIQDYEKLRLLRADLEARDAAETRDGLARLDEMLARFTYGDVQKNAAAPLVQDARQLLNELSRL